MYPTEFIAPRNMFSVAHIAIENRNPYNQQTKPTTK